MNSRPMALKQIIQTTIGQQNWFLHNVIKRIKVVQHLSFLKHCKQMDILPKGLLVKDKLANTYPSAESEKLALKHSRQWRSLLIDHLYVQKRKLESLSVGPLNLSEYKVIQKVLAILRSSKQKKLQHLSKPANEPATVSGFSNLSSIGFSQHEIAILNKGPSYVPPSRPISNSKYTELLADLDTLSSRLKSQVSHLTNEITEFRGGMERIIKEMRDKTVSSNDAATLGIIKSIKAKDAVISLSDKSKRLIAMDKSDYDKMVSDTLNNHDSTKFIQPVSAQCKFNKMLTSVASKYDDPIKRTILSLKTSEPLPSNLYCLPKDHKPGVLKGRPIVAATDTPSTKLSRWLASFFKPLLKFIPSHVPSTAIFKERLLGISRAINLSNFASLDVTNLYGSIPIEDSDDAIGVITTTVNFYERYKNDCVFNLSSSDVGALLRLCLTSDIIHSNGNAYKQLSGLAMGNNIAPILAIIYMHHVESQIVSNLSEKIIFFSNIFR